MISNRRKIGLVCVAICLLLFIWAFFVEPASIRIREQKLNISNWPALCNGIRVAVIGDLHVGSPFKGLDSLGELVENVNRAKPDLILLPGDFVIRGVLGGSFVAPEDFAPVLSKLDAPMGLYAVLGNHDWWFDANRVKDALSTNGIRLLEDRSALLTNHSCQLNLVGISDYMEGSHDVKSALANIEPGDPVLAFTHNPDIFPELPASILLTIAAHTHGGQVRIPGFGPPIVPSRYGQRYAAGHIVEDNRHLYVSVGVGTSILPVRFLVPPEVTILQIFDTNK